MVNSRKIEDLHPYVQAKHKLHIEACLKRGVKVVTVSTLRDKEYQAYLYTLGRTVKAVDGKPQVIVTQVKEIGAHGFGIAYDLCPLSDDGKTALWNDNAKYKIIIEEGRKLGARCGGDWVGFVDKPHFEYTEGLTYTQLRAGKRPSWWEVKKEDIIQEVIKLFKDESNISTWAKDSVNKLSNLGLIKGNEQNEFKPKDSITKEEICVILDRLLKYLGK